MNVPEWLKPGLIGAVVGAVALAAVGFTWGGWVTSGTARQMATEQAQAEVVAALAPVCVERARQDPLLDETLARLRDARSFQRRDIVMQAGWAEMPGASGPDRAIASACAELLSQEL